MVKSSGPDGQNPVCSGLKSWLDPLLVGIYRGIIIKEFEVVQDFVHRDGVPLKPTRGKP